MKLHVDHIAIETSDLDNTVAWYKAFFGAELTWTMVDAFSETTLSRLPGLKRLCEVIAGGLRFHIIERAGGGTIRMRHSQYQHICLSLPRRENVDDLRARWMQLYESGKYKFATSEQPTAINEHGGEANFYALDVNGLEFEFTYTEYDAYDDEP